MKKQILFISIFVVCILNLNAQQCLSSGFCTNITNEHQYPTTTYSTTYSTWTVVSAYMNADNYTLFNVTSGNTYEWSYCEAYGGVSTGWDAQLTLSDNGTGTNICFSDNSCGTTGNAPYISWTATFTGTVKLLTSQFNCLNNSGAPYNTLVWRMANGVPATHILGVDVYSGNNTINWNQVKAAGYTFAYAKATEGVGYTDSKYVSYAVNGVTAGVKMGAYHFARGDLNPTNAGAINEANYFLSVAQPYIISCELPPALDLEGSYWQTNFTGAQLTAWIQNWMNTVESATGIKPVLYIGSSNCSYVNSSLNIYPLWRDDLSGTPNTAPANIGVWTTWVFNQYSWTATVPGIAGAQTDVNVFNGDSLAFANFMGCSTTGIPNQNGNQISLVVYPNPNDGSFKVISKLEGTYLLSNELGETVSEVKLNTENNFSSTINDLSNGVYFLTGFERNNVVRKKVVVAK
jgi:GH25 family lysozyme M1 (1,4-beta-N-acetylmuramidase)